MKNIYLKKVIFISLIALLLSPLTSPAQSMILGIYDCGQWLKDSRYRTSYEMWAIGYLSGLNASSSTVLKTDFLSKINSSEQAFLYLDNYCQKNPLKNIQAGLNLLAIELSSK